MKKGSSLAEVIDYAVHSCFLVFSVGGKHDLFPCIDPKSHHAHYTLGVYLFPANLNIDLTVILAQAAQQDAPPAQWTDLL